MKCPNCSGEWSPPPGKSITACPFCFEPTQTLSEDASSGNIIKEIMQQFGEKVLIESKLYSLAADKLQNKAPRILKRIHFAVNENIPQKLYDLKSVSKQERELRMNAIVAVLKDDYGEETAYEIVNYLGEALGYKPLMVPQSTIKSATPQSGQQPAPTLVTAASTTSGIKITPKIGSIIPFGGYDWRVLDVQNNKALLLSEKVIERKKYHSSRTNITWAKCIIRNYLNDEFHNKFNPQDRVRIAETSVINNNNPWYGTEGGSVTNDRIFLLSIEEVVKYLGDSDQLKNQPKDAWYIINDQYNNARIARDSTGKAWWWWLRSPGIRASSAASVHDVGYLDIRGDYVDGLDVHGLDVYRYGGGVRPALWLNL